MNAELLKLLGDAMPDLRSLPKGWQNLVLLRNDGAVPEMVSARVRYTDVRGFNGLVLDKRGKPSHYCKFRSIGGASLARETSILKALREGAPNEVRVPSAWCAAGARLEVQVAEFIAGSTFAEMVPKLTEGELEAALLEIESVAFEVSRVATEHIVEFAQLPSRSFISQCEGSLARLSDWGYTEKKVATLRQTLLRGSSIQQVPQHSDLFPTNIIRSHRGWMLIDFEVFGDATAPMYDVFHLASGTYGLIERDGGEPEYWVSRMKRGGRAAKPIRSLIGMASKKYELGPEAVLAALTHYQVHHAVTYRVTDRPEEFWRPRFAALEALVSELESGWPLCDFLIHGS